MFYAIEKNRKANVQALLEKGANFRQMTRGADPNHRSKTLMTPLGLAITLNSLPILCLLHVNGARVNAPVGAERSTLLYLVIQCDFDEIAQWLIAVGNMTRAVDREGIEPIYVAARQGKVGMVRLLQACGASLLAKDKKENGLMHFATQSQSIPLIDFLVQEEFPLEPKPPAKEELRVPL